MTKKFLTLTLPALFFLKAAVAQTPVLWGLTSEGGPGDAGVIFNLNTAGNTYTNLYDFQYNFDGNNNGAEPWGNLIQANNGLLYGMANFGGTYNEGVIFSFNPCTRAYTSLYSFAFTYPFAGGDDSSGAYPRGSLLQAGNGLLYGMTSEGGTINQGVLFSFNSATNTYANLYNFVNDSSSGANPLGSLVHASNGLLYGMAEHGGVNNYGVIFSFNTATNTYTNLYSFAGDSNSGASPKGNLIQAANGLLYGMAGGGVNDSGVIFSFNPANNAYTNLYNFANDTGNGYLPSGSLIQAANGLLYGLALNGGANNKGVIFSFNLNTNTYTNLYNFAGGNNSGEAPYGSLVQAGNGLLYGMTYIGGAYNVGVIFSFDTSSNTYANLYNFAGTFGTGSAPYGTLLVLAGAASQVTYDTLNSTICQGDTVYLGIHAYTQSGSHTDTISHIGVCDSIVRLNLNVTTGASPVSISASADSICPDDTAQICATPGFASYAWNNNATGTCIETQIPGAYYLVATDTNGCTAQSNQLNIAVRQGLPVSISANSDSICTGDSSQICATPGFAVYAWNNNATGTCIETQNTGSYNVLVTDNNGCTAQSNSIAIVAQHSAPVNITAGTNKICQGDSTRICATSGFANYIWNPAAGGATGSCIEAQATGNYVVTATDNWGCTAQSNLLNIGVMQPAPVTLKAKTSSICTGDSAFICAPPRLLSYLWNTSATTPCIEAFTTGTYYVTVTESNGCTVQSSPFILGANHAPPVTITTGIDSICPGDSAHICATSGFLSYTWNTSNTGNCIEATSAGDYYVTATDNNGCSIESNHISITALQAPSVNISRFGDTLKVYNASHIQWYLNDTAITGATQSNFIFHTFGSYTVSVTDTDGCTTFSSPFDYTGIENINDDENISIYPNPLSVGNWQLAVGNNLIGAQLEILDADGRVVYKSQIRNLHSEIDAPFAGGVYLLRIITGTGVVVRKLVRL